MRLPSFSLAAALAATLVLPTSAVAQQGQTWEIFNQYFNLEGHRFVNASFGLPSPGNYTMYLSCDVDAVDSAYVDLTIISHVAPWQNADIVSVQWTTQAGSWQHSGVVRFGNTTAGVTMNVEIDAPLIDQLANAPQITFGLAEPLGLEPTVLDLSSNQRIARQFVWECRNVHAQVHGTTLPSPSPETGRALVIGDGRGIYSDGRNISSGD